VWRGLGRGKRRGREERGEDEGGQGKLATSGLGQR
jgi:hypothetical protein